MQQVQGFSGEYLNKFADDSNTSLLINELDTRYDPIKYMDETTLEIDANFGKDKN